MHQAEDRGGDGDGDGEVQPERAVGASSSSTVRRQHEGHHDDWEEPADAGDRGEWVQTMPSLFAGYLRIHNPAARDSPSSVSRSRNRVASVRSSPGMRASLAAAAVWSFTVDSLNIRSNGPAVSSTNCMRP